MTLLANCFSFLEFQLPLPGPQSQHTPSLSTHYAHKTHLWDFPGGPVVQTVLLLQRAWVRSLVRELRSHTPCGALPPPPKKSKLFTFLCPLLGEEDGPREVPRGPPSPTLRRPPPVPGLLPVHLLVMAAHGHGRVRAQQVLVLLPAAAHRLDDGLVRH